MSKVITVDPGKYKCGLVVANIEQKEVYEAIVIKSDLLLKYVKNIYLREDNLKLLVGNGTSSETHIKALTNFFPDLIVAEEKNTTYRAKQRYFEIFPPKGLKSFLPKEIFILNKNLDAFAALIIMEDYYKYKFDLKNIIGAKTWLK